jgi:hypothetical protein
MPKIPQHIIDAVLDAAKIEDVVGDFVHLRKTGVRFTGLCPFHQDRHDGNFIVYPRLNCYHCFTCEAAGDPVKFIMQHERLSFPDAIRWLGRKYLIETDNVPVDYVPPPPKPKPPPLPMLTLPMSLVTQRERDYNRDNLVRWITTGINWDAAQRHRIPYMLAAYHIGHSRAISDYKSRPWGIARHDFTIFWEIDDQQRVRTGKMMKYRPDGHRDREAFYNFDFIHASLARPRIKRDQWGNALTEMVTEADGTQHEEPIYCQPYGHIYDEERQRIEHCLFGLHLIDTYGRQATVNIVESEKTALLMSIAYGNHQLEVWMACGGESNLTRERLAPIINRRRRIVLYPDRDGIEKWQQKAREIGYDLLTVDTTPVTKWWQESDGPKADIADVVIRHINSHSHIRSIEEEPAFKELVEKLDLEIINDEPK